MARASNTEYGSTLYQVQLAAVIRILESPATLDEPETREAVLRFLTKRKSTMGFSKAAFRLDDLTSVNVSGMIETFEDEKSGELA